MESSNSTPRETNKSATPKRETTEPKVINISSKKLSNSEITLLEKGLKFTPTPKQNKKELQRDLQEFGRKLRLLEHFSDREQHLDCSLVSNKSNFIPPMSNDQHLILCLESILNIPEQGTTPKQRSNITFSERKALENLKRDDSIIIKQADKGGATVIMDKSFYRSCMIDMLSDSETYITLQDNEDDKVMSKLNRLTKKYEHELTKKEIDYIQNFSYKTSNFYGLPKIHKSLTISTAIKEQNTTYVEIRNPTDVPFRPIVAGPNSPTHRLSSFIDIILKPLCHKVSSYVRDDLDFLNHIPSKIDENTILVTFDVISLYTNIPHDLGMKAIRYWLENNNASLARPFSTDFILDAISIILKENTFKFDGKNYKQTQGTAMGTKMAPTYATLVMGYLETILYSQYEKLYGQSERNLLVKMFKRFLDDCFLPWNKSRAELTNFHKLLNNLHPKIQFTMQQSMDNLPFLDILLCKKRNDLFTDIYYKGTDTHQYLNFKSCHPKHTKYNIPYCLARRICTIVADDNLRKKRLDELKNFLLRQNYPEQVISKGIEKAERLSIEELRSPNVQEQHRDKILPLVITNNPNNPQIVGKIKENLNFLNNSRKMKSILDKTKLIISRRQPKNLKQHLTKAEFFSQKQTSTVTKCNEPRCGTCDYIYTGESITLKNGKVWKIKSAMNCKAKDIIYLILCQNCDSFYIGQTENLRNRVTLHKEQIRHEQYRHLQVSIHLHACNDGKFKIFPLYQCMDSSRLSREMKEKEIIEILKPDLNTKI